jgi:hypothetical protein
MSRRGLDGLMLSALAVAPIAWAGVGSHSGSSDRTPARYVTPAAVEREATCSGKWRWPVKTLSDGPAALSGISWKSKPMTVGALGELPKPDVKLTIKTPDVPRQPGPEGKTYRVRATLVKMKNESDGDIHLVIADPGPSGKRMVAEFPDASCDGAMMSAKQPSMASARKALRDHCGAPPNSFKKGMLSGTTTIKGVGFFDFLHAATRRQNGIELHPVVGVWKIDCERLPPT